MAVALFHVVMNTTTMELPKHPGFHFPGHHPRLASLTRSKIQLGPKEILILFRALVFLVILVFLFFNEKNNQVIFQFRVEAFLAGFTLSILGMLFMKAHWFENKNILSALFVADTLFISLGLYLSGVGDTDLFLIFFTTVFISALSQDVKSVFSVAIVACTLYGFLQYKTTGQFELSDTVFMVRFPFLFVAAAMSGYMAMETKKNRDEKTRLLGMNQFLAEQADASAYKLMETNRKLKSLLEYHHCVLTSLKTGIIVVQKDGKVRTFNAGARKITGQVEAEMAEKSLEEFPEKLKSVATALQRTLAEGKSYIQDHLELTTDRSEVVPVTLETSLLCAGNGEVIGAIATLKDMTLLRQMETQLVRSERFSALGEMAAGVAHEIKNPLNAIMGFSQRLSAKLQEPILKKYADIISEEVRRMDTIVNDVLEYSRPDKAHKEPSSVHQVLEETLTFLNEKLEKGGVVVERGYFENMPLVAIDIPKIRQVILNLILNAIQAMPKGGTLSIRTKLIEGLAPQGTGEKSEAAIFEQLFLRQKMAAIILEDTGCGIPKENLGKLFHPFFTTKITGTGLGLSICHKIIASHGGTLDVDSVVGKGSVFTIYLPFEEAK
jgi:PAS domain S-box-containing protein